MPARAPPQTAVSTGSSRASEITGGDYRGEALKCPHSAPESLFTAVQALPTAPSLSSAPHLPILPVPPSSFPGGELTSPPPKKVHWRGMWNPRFYCRKTISRVNATQTPHNGGQGDTHMRGGKGAGAGSQQAWPGTVPRTPLSPRVRAGPGAGEAWRRAGPQGDCAIRVCP